MQDMNIWIFQNSKSIFIYADILRTPRLFRYICFDNWLRVVNLHESYNNAIKDRTGNANICDTKLKSCVQQHRVLIEYCRKLENIFMVIVLGQVISCYDVCLVGFQLFLMDMVGDIFEVVSFSRFVSNCLSYLRLKLSLYIFIIFVENFISFINVCMQ